VAEARTLTAEAASEDAVDQLRANRQRSPSLGEEIANSATHGMGLVAAIVGMPFLVLAAARHGSPSGIVGASVFAGSVLLLYFASTVYHALPENGAKRVFRILDHSAIFLLIAGTYTPFTLGLLRGTWGWTLFGAVWSLAVLGVILKAAGGVRYPRLSTVVYVVMGWLALVAIRPLWLRMPVSAWGWLVAGGLAYTAGIAFYASDRRFRYGHCVWHVFVLAGTVCHFFAVLWYAV
jgi:hemolysin III